MYVCDSYLVDKIEQNYYYCCCLKIKEGKFKGAPFGVIIKKFLTEKSVEKAYKGGNFQSKYCILE